MVLKFHSHNVRLPLRINNDLELSPFLLHSKFFFKSLGCFNIFYYFCSRNKKTIMIQALNIQATTNNALYNKGVAYCVSAFESLNTERKIIEKKIANYLVVPNICILSLSLSL